MKAKRNKRKEVNKTDLHSSTPTTASLLLSPSLLAKTERAGLRVKRPIFSYLSNILSGPVAKYYISRNPRASLSESRTCTLSMRKPDLARIRYTPTRFSKNLDLQMCIIPISFVTKQKTKEMWRFGDFCTLHYIFSPK